MRDPREGETLLKSDVSSLYCLSKNVFVPLPALNPSPTPPPTSFIISWKKKINEYLYQTYCDTVFKYAACLCSMVFNYNFRVNEILWRLIFTCFTTLCQILPADNARTLRNGHQIESIHQYFVNIHTNSCKNKF